LGWVGDDPTVPNPPTQKQKKNLLLTIFKGGMVFSGQQLGEYCIISHKKYYIY
jgi:hypothetical protein